MLVAASILSAVFIALEAAPNDFSAVGSAELSGTVPKIFTFENGNVGVDFLGFKASAGLGGLLTGNSADGGLHAEAGTPFGQAARAGLGGSVDGHEGTAGGLYAGASAGNGLSAVAGLEGQTGSSGSYSKAYSGTSAGGVLISKTKVGTPADSDSEVPVKPAEIKQEIIEEVKPQKTYIERSVIPNYREKTIYVPSYVEKTVRVPTVVEKRVRVPAEPTIIEKHVDGPPPDVKFDTKVTEVVRPVPVPVFTKTKTRLRLGHPYFRKHFFFGGGGGYGGGYGISNGYEAPNGALSGASSVTYSKAINADVVNDAFNVRNTDEYTAIPIATLGAVSKLVGGLFGGGSISVNKSFGAGGGYYNY